MPLPAIRPLTTDAGSVSRVSSMTCGSLALPRMTVTETFEPGAPRSARTPSHTDMSRVGMSLIARM